MESKPKQSMVVLALKGLWHVKFSDPQVTELFGTDTLPTCYRVTPTQDKQWIISTLAANPSNYTTHIC